MKKLLLILYVLILPEVGVGQNRASYNGIEVRPAPTNAITFFYGEPINIYFEFSNSSQELKRYHKPLTWVNLDYYLKSKYDGKETRANINFWETGGHIRGSLQEEPTKDQSYQPGEYGQYVIHVNDQFGSESLTQKQVSENHDLGKRLWSLPVGSYELVLKYFLFPSDKVLITSFAFQVVSLPAQEKAAFFQYVNTTVYASNAHFWANKNYSASNPDSYENFIKSHPNSLFAQYAFVDMVREIYNYPGPSQAAKTAKYKEYFQYYPKLKKSNLKMDYLRFLPEFYSRIPGTDVKKELDAVLLKIKS